MPYNPITQDTTPIDTQHRASMKDLRFISHGAMLNGVMYTAQGKDPHPVILLLHGFPGHERNFDLAQIFRRAGYHVVVFHYRGAWGSEGNFAFSHVLQDAEEAIKYLKQPESVARYNIDPENIIAIGHSMGGWAALHLAGNGFVERVASIAGVNVGIWGELAADSPQAKAYSMAFFEESLSPLHGTNADALINEVIQNMDDFDTLQHIHKLSTVDVLLVAGEQDDDVPASLHHVPLVTLLEKRNASQLTHTILDADHGFNDKRLTLAQVVLDWLQS